MGNGSSEGKQETVFFDEDGGSWVPWDIVQGMIDSALARAKASGVAIPESMGSLVVVEVNGQEAVCLHDVVQFFASAPSCVWDNLPDDWKGEFLTPDIWPPPVCRASEQREAVARYLTTAPEVPRIVQRFPIGFGVTPEERLPPDWGPDDLVRWICEKTDAETGKGYLTREGYLRACVLYPITDKMIATVEDLRRKGGTEVLSLAEHLQSGGQDLPPVPRARIYDAKRLLGMCETSACLHLGFRLLKGRLSPDFTTADLLRAFPQRWTELGWDWAKENGLLDDAPPVATDKKPRENAPHGALCEMQPKTITVFRDGGRRFISKADMELIHARMLETSYHAKLPPLPPGVVFAGERKKERNPQYRVEKWIKAECPKEADWSGERGTVSLRELGEFYARHEELWIMLPVALRDYLREELGLRGHRESGIQDNGYGPDGVAEWVSHLGDIWPEPEDGWKPVFTTEIIESGRGPWKPAAPVADAPKPEPIQGRKRAIDGGKVKDWEFKQQVKQYFDKGLGDAEIARTLNIEQEDFDPEITYSKVRAARAWWERNPGYGEKPRAQNAPKKRGGKKG